MTHLCIDFGTSSTVAVVAGPRGAHPVLFDGAPSLPSGVCADPTGRLLVGPDAAHAARTAPERYEPYPKQRIDERSVLLGDVEVAVPDLIAAVLRRVLDQLAAPPRRVTITHPAAWGARRREVLRDAASRAGLHEVRLVSEPVAAAAYFAGTAGATIPVGASAVVCDLGAGTYDASVIRRTEDGFALLATSGLSDGGGLDMDAAIVAHLGAVYAPKEPAAWQRLTAPADAADRRASRALWADVRTGREMLSRAPATHIHLPLLETEAPLGREQFEALARPVIDRTVATTRLVLREAGVEISALRGVLLVGGASRVPLVASMLHRALGVAPAVVEQPELAVANGAVTAEDASDPDPESTVRVTREQVAVAVAAQAAPAPLRDDAVPAQPVSGSTLAAVLHGPPVPLAPLATAERPRADDGDGLAPTRPYERVRASGAATVPAGVARRRRRWPAVVTALLVLAAGGAGYAVYRGDQRDPGGVGPGGPSTAPTEGPLRNDRGEPLDARVVQAVKDANPDDPDAWRSLPGTDYTAPGPFIMVIDSSSEADGVLWFRIREVAQPRTASGGKGPWWIVRGDGAEFQNINGGSYPLESFVAGLPDYPDTQEYAITFDANLAITRIRQQ
ncbi:Hsp70 family protein [Catenuloplanes atrovinosus]|uniref:Hsp70 protein n=1 Tax=Catenuloplanes atrovinosus TaxID=137266 RepID=A0AAE3YIU8_9ACTN|nr:Hsp70 family protein [Catenuloplanes atrovinosus]MDR7274295.1 hypothetical protein [Catenuloplanes atrovinosus]